MYTLCDVPQIMLVHERSSWAVVAIAIVWQSHHAIALLKHVQWSINVVYVCVCKRANFNFTMYRIGEDMHGVNNESEQFFFKHFHVLNILPWIYFVVQKEGVNVHQKTGIPSWVCILQAIITRFQFVIRQAPHNFVVVVKHLTTQILSAARFFFV